MKKVFPLFFLLLVIKITAQKDGRPNIIFILTDDQKWDALGVAGNAIIKTPEMDALANEGFYFKNAFSTTPICAASRASILTGLYERTHDYTFQKPNLYKPYSQLIYPKILKDNGYYLGFFGKLGVNMDNPSQYFHESDFYDRGPAKEKEGYFYKKIGVDTVHLTRYSGNQALQFITNAPKDKPFCLSISFSAPHGHDPSVDQYFWQEKSNLLYEKETIPPPSLASDVYFDNLPLEVRQGFNRTRWKWRFDSAEKYQRMMKGYYRMITEIDDEIGSIRKLLQEKKIAENTIIIIMGDNGYFTGDRQLADKWLMYDASIRIPLIIYDPRKTQNAVINEMALNIDIPSTILSFAEIKIPKTYQGISLVPFLQKKKISSPRDYILIEHLWKLPEIPSSEGIRTRKWKYFRYRFINAPEELYNLKKDPLETKNLADNPKYCKILEKLRNNLFDKTENLIMNRLH